MGLSVTGGAVVGSDDMGEEVLVGLNLGHSFSSITTNEAMSTVIAVLYNLKNTMKLPIQAITITTSIKSNIPWPLASSSHVPPWGQVSEDHIISMNPRTGTPWESCSGGESINSQLLIQAHQFVSFVEPVHAVHELLVEPAIGILR